LSFINCSNIQLIYHTYQACTLFDQLTNFLIVHGSPLNLAKDPSAISPIVWNDLPFDTRLSPTTDTFKPRSHRARRCARCERGFKRRLKTFLFAMHSLPVLPTYSDCRRLRFSFTADFCAPYKLLHYYYYNRQKTGISVVRRSPVTRRRSEPARGGAYHAEAGGPSTPSPYE